MKYFNLILFAVTAIFLVSCNQDYLENDNLNTSEGLEIQIKTIAELNLSKTEKLRLDFGRVFALAPKKVLN
jgi:hypothetical protein